MTEKKGGTKELNLGLTELLSKVRTESGHGGSSQRAETSIVTVEDDLGGLNPELSKLAESRQWGMLVSRAESSIASEEDIEARLWWIRGHLGAFTLPVSLLAAPFETVCRHLVGDSRTQLFGDLVREIGGLMLVRLRDVGDRRQEYSVGVALSRLGLSDSSKPVQASYGKVPPKVQRFELGVPETKPTAVVSQTVNGRSRTHDSGSRWPVRILATAIMALLLAGVGAGWHHYNREPVLLTAQEGFVDTGSAAGMLPPAVVARPVSSNLGALFYSIDKGEGSGTQSAPQQGGSRTGEQDTSRSRETSVTGGIAAAASRQVGEVRPPAPAPGTNKERVKTDGPIEGPDFTRGVERNSAPQAKLPDVVVEPDLKPVPNASYPDGSLNVGGEMKSAIVRTDVFDSPSYHARVIARLVPGDKVSVEGRVGQWFRIRSRRGRAGFVFAQDIGEIEEFNLNSAVKADENGADG
jgi:hypothetical protein